MIKLISLSCPNCTAPLHPQAHQTVVACLYCNSTIRLSYAEQAQPAAATLTNVPPEVVDEVKRLLILGLRVKAVEYYAQTAGISEGDAAAAVSTIHESIAYAPPLSIIGLFMLVGGLAVSLVGLLSGSWLVISGSTLAGLGVLILAVLFGLIVAFAFGRGLPGFLLERRGRAAQATIIKVWPIRTFIVGGREAHLLRFLLEIQEAAQPAYQTEANGAVKAESLPKFQPGSVVRAKVDPANRGHVVMLGPQEM